MNFTDNLVVVLLATLKEHKKGQVKTCLEKCFNCRASEDKKIDLYIFFNKPGDYGSLLEYKNYENVNDVKIICHNLQGLDDLYARTPEELRLMNLPQIPDLGGSAGANNLFYDSMIPMCDTKYKNCLMLETDSYPVVNNWIDGILDYCHNNQFLIGGSIYKGNQPLYKFGAWTGHVNGVAIYRICSELKILLRCSRRLIQCEVSSGAEDFISFDCALHLFSCSLDGIKFFRNRKLPQNHIIDTDIITNHSLEKDQDTSVEEILKDHPRTIILHKK